MKKRHDIGRLLPAAGCALALLLAGCGSDDEGQQLPRSSVADLERSLGSIQRRFELGGGACKDITEGDDTDASAVQSKIEALPADVDKDVQDALEESFDRLFRLVEDECAQTETETETETETTPTQTVPTVTETVPTVTETVPPETTPTETTTSPAPGDGNDGKNEGKGGGNSGRGSGGEQAPGGG